MWCVLRIGLAAFVTRAFRLLPRQLVGHGSIGVVHTRVQGVQTSGASSPPELCEEGAQQQLWPPKGEELCRAGSSESVVERAAPLAVISFGCWQRRPKVHCTERHIPLAPHIV